MQFSGTFYSNGSIFVGLERSSCRFSHAELSAAYSYSYDSEPLSEEPPETLREATRTTEQIRDRASLPPCGDKERATLGDIWKNYFSKKNSRNQLGHRSLSTAYW